MLATTTQSRPHPPLAHDPHGHSLALPDGAAGWRVKRQTAGRPRVCVGPDRQPLRFPLETTSADLHDMLGSGCYRLDAIDAVGEVLDYVTSVSVGRDSASESTDSASPAIGARSTTTGGSDLRFALEVAAQMARAQSDALRSIAEAQADWIKGLASAKAIPRNAFMYPPQPPPVPDDDDDDDDEEDDDEEGAEDDGATPFDPLRGVNTMLGHVAGIAQHVSPLVTPFLSSKEPPARPPEPRNAAPALDTTEHTLHVAQILAGTTAQARDVMCRLLARNDDRARTLATSLHELPIADAIAEVEKLAESLARKRRPPEPSPPTTEQSPTPPVDFARQLDAVKALLTPIELAQVMATVATTPPDQLETLKAFLASMSPTEAADWIRREIASRVAPATGGPDVA